MMERWLPIPGYLGRYEVSDFGGVRALRHIRGGMNTLRSEPLTLKQHLRAGYPFVNLSIEGSARSFSVHTLVALAFIGPRPDSYVARHLDGDRRNPALSNLAYGTYSENEADKAAHGTRRCGEDAPGATLSEVRAREILSLYRANSRTAGAPALARQFGVNTATVHYLVKGRTWRHIDRSVFSNLSLPPERQPKRHRKLVSGICVVCEGNFTSPSHRPNPKTCSKACVRILLSRTNRWGAKMPEERGPLFVAVEP